MNFKMKSIRPRFLLISAIVIAIALVATALVFIAIFERNLERRVDAELTIWGNQIAAGLTFDEAGKLIPPGDLSDNRFSIPYGGLYWQIEDPAAGGPYRSRSLWDFEIELPEDQHDAGEIHTYTLPGPDNSQIYVQERSLIVATPTGARTIRISVATDRATLALARNQFISDILPYVLVLGLFLLGASAFQLALGLRPLGRVSRDLKAIEDAPGARLDGSYPREIGELVAAVNSLLDAQQKTIAKSRSRAADLAHGLKTPLTVLANNAEKLRSAGHPEMADEIAALSTTMQKNIDHELARSRIATVQGIGSSKSGFADVINEVRRTLEKTPKGENIDWQIGGDLEANVRLDPHDLRELMGNILENAMKWARTKVIVQAQRKAEMLHVTVEDNGPGIAADKIAEMTARGKRFDETIDGTGFGLSIVKDIVENYSLPFSIQNRQENGLCVTVELPLAERKQA